MSSPRVLYVSIPDASDPKAWSGIPHRVVLGLRAQGLDVRTLSPLKRPVADVVLAGAARARRLAGHNIVGWRDRHTLNVLDYARQIRNAVRDTDPDVILTTSTIPTGLLRTDVPVVLWGGSTAAQMIGYYPEYSSLSRSVRSQWARIEYSAFHGAAAVIMASRWAADSVVSDYGVCAEKVSVVPWGGVDLLMPVEAATLDERLKKPMRLLLVGVDWSRKGGDYAVEIREQLASIHGEVHLDVVGMEPQTPLDHPYVHFHGRLDRADSVQREKLERLFAHAGFLLALSEAEAYGQVVNEASAAWLPSIATDTGGLRDAVSEGVNGWLLPFGTSALQAATVIADQWSVPSRYRASAVSARALFETERSWPTVTAKIADALRAASPHAAAA